MLPASGMRKHIGDRTIGAYPRSMNATEHLHTAYVSELAPGQDYSAFGAICRRARARNVERGIAGVLLFDGHRFFQWLYGARDTVARLMAVIVADPRHQSVRLHFEAVLPAVSGVPEWRAGFIDADALDAFLARDSRDLATLLPALAQLLGQADLDGG
jgi:hypothetical protein